MSPQPSPTVDELLEIVASWTAALPTAEHVEGARVTVAMMAQAAAATGPVSPGFDTFIASALDVLADRAVVVARSADG